MAFAATASKRCAFVDMNKAAIDVAQALARLSELTIFELRGEWRRLHRMPPPMWLSRDLLSAVGNAVAGALNTGLEEYTPRNRLALAFCFISPNSAR